MSQRIYKTKEIKVIFLFCLMIEGSGAGSALVTHGFRDSTDPDPQH